MTHNEDLSLSVQRKCHIVQYWRVSSLSLHHTCYRTENIRHNFNARVSNERDFVENDKFDPEMSPISYDLPPRSSEDKILNTRGKELLDLCKTHSFCIINGRKTGDIPANFTSFQPNGNSVIDYGIASQSLFPSVVSFTVGDFRPWLSDHCPIQFSLDIRKACKKDESNEQYDQLPTKWYWDDDCAEKYENVLKTDESRGIRTVLDGKAGLSLGGSPIPAPDYYMNH